MSKPKPATPWQETLPGALPLYLRRNIESGPGGCWLWTRTLNRDGYGLASFLNKTHQAHRLVYRLVVGEPPAETVMDHLCRVRRCVNPAHLEPVTNAENLLRSPITATGMTRCSRGHELVEHYNQRRCLVCKAEYQREYDRRRRAATRSAA